MFWRGEILKRFSLSSRWNLFQEVEVSDDNVVLRMPLIETHAYYSYIRVLTMYKGQRVHLVWECARHKLHFR